MWWTLWFGFLHVIFGTSLRKTASFMFGKNPDLYKLEEIIVCIKMFTGYYPTAHPIFILEMISSGKWENFQLIPLPRNISILKGILRLFPAKKKWTSSIHGCKPAENLSSNNAQWLKVEAVSETRVKAVLKGSFPWREVKPAQLMAIHPHSIQPFHVLVIPVTSPWFISTKPMIYCTYHLSWLLRSSGD